MLSRGIKSGLIILLGLAMTGCISMKMPEPTATMSNLEKIRGANVVPAKTGSFKLAAGKTPSLDKSVSGLRGSSVSPHSGSFAEQLRAQLEAELKAAGLYDAQSNATISGELIDSQVDVAIGTGTAKLSARFIVDQANTRIYDKVLTADASWPSSFVGAIAIPEAINQYTALYQTLIGKLFEDQDFRQALRKK